MLFKLLKLFKFILYLQKSSFDVSLFYFSILINLFYQDTKIKFILYSELKIIISLLNHSILIN